MLLGKGKYLASCGGGVEVEAREKSLKVARLGIKIAFGKSGNKIWPLYFGHLIKGQSFA